ncbi:DUF4407 domain-containing protein [Actinoallomurus iriomotensis]|uniref:DUF4407 domain-containing protein n=1 Tax=Actinoallomurus iriomotensis TaxID=478107 RepID=A0A9W6RXB5_9ACTN|nr:DUF4407 domain-containing protein [Actinoallomurus iriomotensis]GLY83323.1 hypothetical protein Airi02_012530 [Actinoallomurus iriomotensis]
MRRFLIYLSGARPDILETTPTDLGKFEGVGGAVLITSTLALVSMTTVLSFALNLTLLLALPVAAFWALAVMSLDRWLVASIPSSGTQRWAMAAPRILMAILLGVVISTPLIMQVFRSEIDARLVTIKQRNAEAIVEEFRRGPIGQQISTLESEQAQLERTIETGGALDPNQDPQLRSLTAERKTEQAKADAYLTEWQCLLYSGKGCANSRTGDGPLVRVFQARYRSAADSVKATDDRIAARKKELATEDSATRTFRLNATMVSLQQVQARLTESTREQSRLQSASLAANQADDGLLIRLRALDEVSQGDIVLRTTQVLLFLLFMLIMCLPVTVRLLQRPGAYEKVLALAERSEYRAARDAYSGLRRERPDASAVLMSIEEIWARTPPDEATGHGREDDESEASTDSRAVALEHTRLSSMEEPSTRRPDPRDLFAEEDEY